MTSGHEPNAPDAGLSKTDLCITRNAPGATPDSYPTRQFEKTRLRASWRETFLRFWENRLEVPAFIGDHLTHGPKFP
jgi:hypothetical protein